MLIANIESVAPVIDVLVFSIVHYAVGAKWLDLFAWGVRLSRLKVGFRKQFKSLHFHSFYFLNIY